MRMTAYHRAVRDVLREQYGVTDEQFEDGSKHPRVTFTYQGEPHHLTLHRFGGDSALRIKLGDLRRDLGPPPTQLIGEIFYIEGEKHMDMFKGGTHHGKPMATLADVVSPQARHSMKEIAREMQKPIEQPLTPRPQPTKLLGHVARYKDKQVNGAERERLRFSLPQPVAALFGESAVHAIQIGEDTWRLVFLTGARNPVVHDYGYGPEVQVPLERSPHPFIGKTKAEYVIDGNEVIVALTERPVAPKVIKRVVPVEASPEPQPTAPAEFAIDETTMRHILELARKVEAACPYRLERMPDKQLGWVAPAII